MSTYINSDKYVERVSGVSPQIHSSTECDALDYKIEGNSTQETRSGKNLLDITKFQESLTVNGVTMTVDKETQTITLNGTFENAKSSILNITELIEPIKRDTSYTLNITPISGSIINNDGDYAVFYLGGCTEDDKTKTNFVNSQNFDVDDAKTITNTKFDYVHSMWIYIHSYVENGWTFDNYTFKVQFEEGDTSTEWEKYGAVPSPEFPSEVESVGEKTKNLLSKRLPSESKTEGGVTWTVNEDGSITAEGTPITHTAYAWNKIPIKINTTYALTNIEGSSNLTWRVAIYDENETMIKIISGSDVVFTTPDNAKSIDVELKRNLSNIEIPKTTVYPQLEEGEVATEYEPYGYKVPIVVAGKNLYDFTNPFDIKWTYSCNDIKFLLQKIPKNVNFIMSMTLRLKEKNKDIYTNSDYCNIIIVTNKRNFGSLSKKWNDDPIGTVANVYCSIKLDDDEVVNNVYIYGCGNNTLGPTGTATVLNIQLEEGKVVTPYEPYREPTIQNIYLNEPLRKIGDASDYVDYQNSKVVRKIGRLYLTGNEQWFTGTGSSWLTNNSISFFTNDYNGKIKTSDARTVLFLSNNVMGVPSLPREEYVEKMTNVITSSSNGTQINIKISKDVVSNIEEFKSWLKEKYDEGNPLYVDYVLATLIEEDIILPPLPLSTGSNKISILTDTQPSNVEVVAAKEIDSDHTLQNSNDINGKLNILRRNTGFKGFDYKHIDAENNFISVADNMIKDAENYHIEGNSTQETRSGENLFDINTVDITDLSAELINRTETGFIAKMKDTAQNTIPGSTNHSSGRINIQTTGLAIGKTYIISFDITYTNPVGTSEISRGMIMNFCELNKEYIFYPSVNNKFHFSRQSIVKDGWDGQIIFCCSSCTITVENIQITEGETELPYEPYGAMPSPEFPSEVESVGEKTKNLFDINAEMFQFSISTNTITSSSGWRTIFIPNIKNTKITISTSYSLNDSIYYGFANDKSIGSEIYQYDQIQLSKSKTIDTGDYNYLVINIWYSFANEAIQTLYVSDNSDNENNLFDIKNSKQGRFLSDGRFTSGSDYTNFIDVSPNTVYIISGSTFSASNLSISSVNSDDTLKEGLFQGSSNKSFRTPADCNRIAFSHVLNDNCKVEMYEPYGYKVPIEVSGKNLVNEKNITSLNTMNISKITYSENPSIKNTLTLSGIANITDDRINPNVLARFYYTDGTISQEVYRYKNRINEKILFTIRPVEEKEIDYLVIWWNNAADMVTTGGATIKNPQLETGETATPYEPYREPIITNIYLTEPLLKIGDVADYVDYECGKVVRKIKRIHLTSNMSYSTYAWYGTTGILTNCLESNLHNRSLGLSNRESTFIWTRKTDRQIWLGVNDRVLYWTAILTQLGLSTIDEFKTWLDEHPTYVDYVLVEPIEEDIELPPLPLPDKTNILSVKTDIEPSNFSIDYKTRLQEGWTAKTVQTDENGVIHETNCKGGYSSPSGDFSMNVITMDTVEQGSKIKICGKNLFDKSTSYLSSSNAHFEETNAGLRIVSNITSTTNVYQMCQFGVIPTVNDAIFHIAYKTRTNNPNLKQTTTIFVSDNNGNNRVLVNYIRNYSSGDIHHYTFTIPKDIDIAASPLIGCNLYVTAGTPVNKGEYMEYNDIMIFEEKEETNVSYEPYIGKELTVPCDLSVGDTWNPVTGEVVHSDCTITTYIPQKFIIPKGEVNIVSDPNLGVKVNIVTFEPNNINQ